MSDLNPRGISAMIDGGEHKLLFSINAIDEIQDRLDMPFLDAIEHIAHIADWSTDKEDLKALKTVLSVLISTPEKQITDSQIGDMIEFRELQGIAWKILEAYGISMPEPAENEEDEDDEDPKEAAETSM